MTPDERELLLFLGEELRRRCQGTWDKAYLEKLDGLMARMAPDYDPLADVRQAEAGLSARDMRKEAIGRERLRGDR